ncbi:DMT family transporter [uncultured Pelagimonas sp.]|uniref:DMT family transporter n=1 Tax=uncultured Pelagimonas sp. TaxID=1618102 RepID=UPI0026208EE1|nr:DMT family transporter [uncultured Pelagimonas sp.]
MDQARPSVGIFWMVVTGLCFVAVTALVKTMHGRVPAPEAAFLRYVLGLVFVIPFWRELRNMRPTRRQWKLMAVRGVFQSLGVAFWFFAMTRIPLAEVTSMNYLNPIFVTLLAVLLLGEKLALRRILAIAVAMIGALIILRPGFRELDPGHLAMLITASCFAASYLIAKILSAEVSPAMVVATMSVSVTIGLAPLAIPVWVWPSWWDVGILFLVACFATGGHYAMTLAFKAAPLTVTQPVTFLQLVWSVALGALLFDEAVDPWVIAGGGIIMGAVVFITLREAALNRRVTPGVVETKH